MDNSTILLVEDDKAQAILTIKALRRNSSVHRIIYFQDGQEILDYLMSCQNIDRENFIVLLDIQMPRINGIEVLKEIKNHDRLKSLPIIMFSSVTDSEIIDLCHSYGCNEFISKSIFFDDFEYLSKLDFLTITQAPDIC